MNHDLFWLFSLFFPRLTLWITWLQDGLPHHVFPFWGSFWMTILMPRVLILVYMCQNNMVGGVWFWLQLFFMVFSGIAWMRKMEQWNEQLSKLS